MGRDVVFVLPAHYLVSSADVQAVAERDGFGGIGFALPFGTSFEDEPSVDVPDLIPSAGDEQGAFALVLPFDALDVGLLLHLHVLSPVEPVVVHVPLHEPFA